MLESKLSRLSSKFRSFLSGLYPVPNLGVVWWVYKNPVKTFKDLFTITSVGEGKQCHRSPLPPDFSHKCQTTSWTARSSVTVVYCRDKCHNSLDTEEETEAQRHGMSEGRSPSDKVMNNTRPIDHSTVFYPRDHIVYQQNPSPNWDYKELCYD